MDIRIGKQKLDTAKEFSSFLVEKTKSAKELHIALSGGSTPKIVFDVLADTYAEAINWSKVHLYWGDERCVPPNSDESNYKMTVTHLISKVTISKANIHRILGENDPQEEAARYSKVLQEQVPVANEIPQFDLVVLGMGDDGHTASIFPHELSLWHSKENCVVATHPDSGQKRVSLTGKVINNAKTVAFLVTGDSKAPKVKAILANEVEAKEFPASYVAPTSENVVWFLDAAAARLTTM